MNVRLTPSEVRGTVTAPPSKSMAHRAILCAALAPGRSRVDNLAFSQDILATLNAVRALGARVETGDSWAVIDGPQRIAAQDGVCVDCAESGSTLRFLIPVFAQTGADVRFTGRGRLLERPQNVYEQLFAEKGIAFTHTPAEVRVRGPLPAGEYEVDGGVSSQFITGLLLAARRSRAAAMWVSRCAQWLISASTLRKTEIHIVLMEKKNTFRQITPSRAITRRRRSLPCWARCAAA